MTNRPRLVTVGGVLNPSESVGPGALAARKRAVLAAACFAGGLWVASQGVCAAGSASLASGAIGAGGMAMAAAGPRSRAMWLALAMALLGAGWYALQATEAPAHSALWRLPQDPLQQRLLVVEARLLDDPLVEEAPPEFAFAQRGRWSAPLQALALRDGTGWRRASGELRLVVMEETAPELRAGDRIVVSGWAARRQGPMNPGDAGAGRLGLPAGALGSLHAPSSDLVELAGERDALGGRAQRAWLRWRAGARAYLARAMAVPPDNGAGSGPGTMLAAIALGQRDFDSDTEQAFRRVGLAHLMAISGLHLAILIAGAAALLRLLGDFGRWEAVLLTLLVLAALAIIPARAPIVRAAVMALALLGGRAMGRRWDPVATLAWTAVLILLWRPAELWSLGFQLSFGLVAALMTLGPAMHHRLFGQRVIGGLERPPTGWRWLAQGGWMGLKGLIGASVLCWLVALPLTLHHTGMLSPLAIPATVVTLPLIALTLLLAYALALLGLLLPAAAEFAAGGLGWLARLTHEIVVTLDGAPLASFTLPRVSLAWTAAATAAAVYIVLRGRWRDGRTWALIGVALGGLALEVQRAPGLRRGVALRIDTLSVGDGTCHLIRSGDMAMLWDCGSLRPGLGRTTIPRAVRELGVWKAPLVVLTHPNLDHYNALAEAAGPLGVRRVILGEGFMKAARRPHTGPQRLLEQLESRGVAIDVAWAGGVFALGETRFELLAPRRGATFDRINNHSLVALATTAGGGRLLLTGDIEREAIRWLLERGADLKADVLEAPHHGAPTDAAYELLAAAAPRAAVQSSGRRLANHPAWEDMRRQLMWLQTPVHGATWVELLEDGAVRAGAMRRP